MDPSISAASEPPVLWRPDPALVRDSAIVGFARYVAEAGLAQIDDELDYDALHAWSSR